MSTIDSKEQYETTVHEAAELFNNKKYEQSLVRFLQLADANYENTMVHEMLCENYLKLGNIQMAEKEYDTLIDLSKKQGRAPRMRSFHEVVNDLGDDREIEEDYQQMMDRSETASVPVEESEKAIKYGLILMSQGKFKEAEAALVRFKDAIA